MLFTISSVLSLVTFSFEFTIKSLKFKLSVRGSDIMKLILFYAIGCGMGLYDGSKREQIKSVRD